MRLSDIKGNSAIVSALRGMVDTGRIPHAMLFHENDGGGALLIVLSFLQYLYCRDRRGGDSCGECPSCNKISKLIHPDVHFVFPVASKGSVEKPTSETFISEWRELVLSNPYFFENQLYDALGLENKQGVIAVSEAKSLLAKLSLFGVEGGYRSVIVYLPEKMNIQAANTLLKMVEEPPEKTIFLMITHEPEKVLSTIYSRCLFMRVRPLGREDLRSVHPEEDAEYSTYADIFGDLMNALVARDLLTALETADALIDLKNREKQKSFFKFASEALRKIFLLQQESEYYNRLAGSVKRSFSRVALTYMDRAQTLLERNVNQKIIFTDLVNRLYVIV